MKILMRSILNIEVDMNGVTVSIKELVIFIQVRYPRENYIFFQTHDIIGATALLFAVNRNRIVLQGNHFHTHPWDEFPEAGDITFGRISCQLLKYVAIEASKIRCLPFGSVSAHNYPYLEGMIPKLPIGMPVHFLGDQSEECSQKLIAKAKLCLHTSRQNPVVALRYEAVNETSPDETLINPDWDTAKIARYLFNIFGNKTERNTLQKKPYRYFLNKYTVNKMGDTYPNYQNKSWSLV